METKRPLIKLPKSADIPADRDLAVDAARVGCLLLVVLIHLLMVAAVATPDGIVFTKPLEDQTWFTEITWVGQIMPLFFILGGYTGIRSWRSTVARGETASSYIYGRLLRLLRPAVPFFAVMAVLQVGGSALGVPGYILDGITGGVGTPLWFLAAFLLAQCAVPFTSRLHEQHRWRALALLGAAVIFIDMITALTGISAITWANFLFVWLFVQQLGFFLLDGSLARLRGLPGGIAWLLAIIAVSYLLLTLGVLVGWYSPNMLANQNPPRGALALLGVAQLAAFQLVAPLLRRAMRARALQAVVFIVGSRAMSVYLWHLPVIVVLTGVLLLMPTVFQIPGTAFWWITRLPAYLLALTLVLLLATPLARFESIPAKYRTGTPAALPLAAAVLLTFTAAFLVTVAGLLLPTAVFGITATTVALLLLRSRPAAAATRL